MPAFIQENLLLILLIVGAILSFLGSFIALVADKKPVSVLAVLLVVGAALLAGSCRGNSSAVPLPPAWTQTARRTSSPTTFGTAL